MTETETCIYSEMTVTCVHGNTSMFFALKVPLHMKVLLILCCFSLSGNFPGTRKVNSLLFFFAPPFITNSHQRCLWCVCVACALQRGNSSVPCHTKRVSKWATSAAVLSSHARIARLRDNPGSFACI